MRNKLSKRFPPFVRGAFEDCETHRFRPHGSRPEMPTLGKSVRRTIAISGLEPGSGLERVFEGARELIGCGLLQADQELAPVSD